MPAHPVLKHLSQRASALLLTAHANAPFLLRMSVNSFSLLGLSSASHCDCECSACHCEYQCITSRCECQCIDASITLNILVNVSVQCSSLRMPTYPSYCEYQCSACHCEHRSMWPRTSDEVALLSRRMQTDTATAVTPSDSCGRQDTHLPR